MNLYYNSRKKTPRTKNIEFLAVTGDYLINEESEDVELVIGIKNATRLHRQITNLDKKLSQYDNELMKFVLEKE